MIANRGDIMPVIILLMWSVLFLAGMRRLLLYKRVGETRYAKRIYRRLAVMLSACLYASMAVQIFLVYESGGNLIATILPLHLCGMMGLITAPMLLLDNRILRAFYFFVGLPCAFLALLFPAIMSSDRPQLMTLAFSSLHSLIVLAAVLPLLNGQSIRPTDAFWAFGIGLILMGIVYVLNLWLNTNYMFLQSAPPNTPLAALYALGKVKYILSMIGIGFAVIMLEGFCVYLFSQRRQS